MLPVTDFLVWGTYGADYHFGAILEFANQNTTPVHLCPMGHELIIADIRLKQSKNFTFREKRTK